MLNVFQPQVSSSKQVGFQHPPGIMFLFAWFFLQGVGLVLDIKIFNATLKSPVNCITIFAWSEPAKITTS